MKALVKLMSFINFLSENLILIFLLLLLLLVIISTVSIGLSKMFVGWQESKIQPQQLTKVRHADGYFHKRRIVWLVTSLLFTCTSAIFQIITLFCTFIVIYIALNNNDSLSIVA